MLMIAIINLSKRYSFVVFKNNIVVTQSRFFLEIDTNDDIFKRQTSKVNQNSPKF